MLGLRRHTVQLQPHNPAWVMRAGQEIQRIMGASSLPHERVQHVGSTSVPDLLAKPILDIDIGVLEKEDVEVIVSNLVDLGFIDRGDHNGGIGRLLVWEAAPEIRTVHIHIIPFDSVWWRQDLAFRDALRDDLDLRERYAALKTELASRHSSSRADYRHGKNPFIVAALERIIESSSAG